MYCDHTNLLFLVLWPYKSYSVWPVPQESIHRPNILFHSRNGCWCPKPFYRRWRKVHTHWAWVSMHCKHVVSAEWKSYLKHTALKDKTFISFQFTHFDQTIELIVGDCALCDSALACMTVPCFVWLCLVWLCLVWLSLALCDCALASVSCVTVCCMWLFLVLLCFTSSSFSETCPRDLWKDRLLLAQSLWGRHRRVQECKVPAQKSLTVYLKIV